MVFANRNEAGMLLADKLAKYNNAVNTIVLGVPRGGVPVADCVAQQLNLPLDVILSKKIGHPFNKEFAIGAVTENLIFVEKGADVDEDYIQSETQRIRKQLAVRNQLFRKHKPPLIFKNKTIILVDDGIATGNTLLILVQMMRQAGVSKIVIASPVVPSDRVNVIERSCDEFVYLHAPEYFEGVGAFYDDFTQVEDEDVVRILEKAK
ncbi:MAG: phosphoribosyltransferase [Bacteroidetes bacterium]|nr:phosphoribosyltransferase [Bacteroidota bacterium]